MLTAMIKSMREVPNNYIGRFEKVEGRFYSILDDIISDLAETRVEGKINITLYDENKLMIDVQQDIPFDIKVTDGHISDNNLNTIGSVFIDKNNVLISEFLAFSSKTKICISNKDTHFKYDYNSKDDKIRYSETVGREYNKKYYKSCIILINLKKSIFGHRLYLTESQKRKLKLKISNKINISIH